MKKENKFFSKQLGKIMVEKGLNQSELSAKIGIAQTVISRWVRGESIPNITSTNKLASFFNVPLNYFTIKDKPEEDNNKTIIKNEELILKLLKEVLDTEKELLKIVKAKK